MPMKISKLMPNKKDNKINIKGKRGFVAVVSVFMLMSGATAFGLVTLGAVILYYESVNLREYRLQARLNLKACIDTIATMANRDFFISGDLDFVEFGCKAKVINDNNGHIRVEAVSKFNQVSVGDNAAIFISS